MSKRRFLVKLIITRENINLFQFKKDLLRFRRFKFNKWSVFLFSLPRRQEFKFKRSTWYTTPNVTLAFKCNASKICFWLFQDHLMDAITKQKNFWSDDDDLVLKAIREGFLSTQQNMWNDLPSWKKTGSGLPSTAGTTASVCFIKRGKLFIGHVGDSGIILGERDPHHPTK